MQVLNVSFELLSSSKIHMAICTEKPRLATLAMGSLVPSDALDSQCLWLYEY